MSRIKLPRYVFTDSGLVALSSVPLLLSAIGLYGMLISGLGDITLGTHAFLLGACLVPAVSVVAVLAWIEGKRRRKIDRFRNRRKIIRDYGRRAPINNGRGALPSYVPRNPAPAAAGSGEFEILPGLSIKPGENPFRPVTDQAIDETLIRLAKAKNRLKHKA